MEASAERQIFCELDRIEREEHVRILYAAESGSRAWGFASPDSDFDVRFLYVRPEEEYLRLDSRRDVIEALLNEELDVNGWDLQKALRLLHASNPTLFEWLSSPIVYRCDPAFETFRTQRASAYFSTRSGLWHYLNMAKGNYREYLQGDRVKLKKYFYVIRPILAAKHILRQGTPPPMLFDTLVDGYLEPDVRTIVRRLLEQKVNAPELELIPRVEPLNLWIEERLREIPEMIEKMPVRPPLEWEELNQVFLKWIRLSFPLAQR